MPFTDDLAALRDGRRYSRRDEQPRKLKLDTGLSLELPSPRVLAATFALPQLRERFDVFRSGGTIVARPKGTDSEPTGLDQLAAAADLRAALAALPDRPDAGRPYHDLRLFVTEAERATVAAYLTETIAAVRPLVGAWKPLAAATDRSPAKTPRERKAAQRERERAAEIESARWWLELTIDEPDEDLPTGTQITAAALYELAEDALADLADDGELLDDDDPNSIPRIPGPRVFYSVADDLLGTRRRGTNGAQTYTLPPAFNIARTRSLLRRRHFARALLLQREHIATDD